ncbi:hepatitis A virus cellular receptor 2-like [Ahaetulla prasina]|uniref:hepatitis A virus cellular receptor 2-like n=1 Tax=Ahaetulla prasina TaxID=499056 RepID=UPI0026476AB2|nr:hepatitis A virus cellular receptor 2-like [Ahaetulla prasina]
MFSCLLLKQILLMLLTGSFTSYAETVIQGKVGENITLPCHYSVKDNGLTDICWGRSCPAAGSCPNKMISINKYLEIDGQLQKYHLMGSVSQGDVSLTIANITEDDVGTYCCRVEYQGWFNDGKIFFKLLIKEALLYTTPIYFSTSNFVPEPKLLFITESPLNNISLYRSIMVKEQTKNSPYRIGLYLGIGICVILFAIIILLLIKWYLHKKQKTINSTSQVAFTNSAAQGIQHVVSADVHAPENIYHCF